MDNLNKVLSVINNDAKYELIGYGEWLTDDSYAIMFKVNGHNVYRTILFSDSLVFQCVQCAFYVGGEEYYDEAVDYKMAITRDGAKSTIFDETDVIDDDVDGYVDKYFTKWVDECEQKYPKFTEYEK